MKAREEVFWGPELVFPCSPWSVVVEQISACRPVKKPMLELVDVPEGGCHPIRS